MNPGMLIMMVKIMAIIVMAMTMTMKMVIVRVVATTARTLLLQVIQHQYESEHECRCGNKHLHPYQARSTYGCSKTQTKSSWSMIRFPAANDHNARTKANIESSQTIRKKQTPIWPSLWTILEYLLLLIITNIEELRYSPIKHLHIHEPLFTVNKRETSLTPNNMQKVSCFINFSHQSITN